MQTLLKLIVTDKPGVLDRITGVIRRNGWNIDSLCAARQEPGSTQINILLKGRNLNTQTLGMHLAGLDFVIRWEEQCASSYDFMETMLFSVAEEDFSEERFPDARVLSKRGGIVRAETTQSPEALDEILALHGKLFTDMARTGCVALGRCE